MNWEDLGMIALLCTIWGIVYMFNQAGKKIDEWQRVRKEAIDSHRALNEAIILWNYGAKEEAFELMKKHGIPYNERTEA